MTASPDEGSFLDALTAAEKIQNSMERGSYLLELASRLPNHLVQEFLTATDKLENTFYRIQIYTLVTDRLPPDQRTALYIKILSSFNGLITDPTILSLLDPILAELSTEQLRNAIELSLLDQPPGSQIARLTLFALWLPEGEQDALYRRALHTAGTIDNAQVLTEVLNVLEKRMRNSPSRLLLNELKEELIFASKNISDHLVQIDFVLKYCGQLSEESRKKILDRILMLTRAMDKPYTRAELMIKISERLSGNEKSEFLEEAIENARLVPDPAARLNLLWRLPKSLLSEQEIALVNKSDGHTLKQSQILVPRLAGDTSTDAPPPKKKKKGKGK